MRFHPVDELKEIVHLGEKTKGKYKRSALGTLVERPTRYTNLVPLGDKKDAVSVRKAYQTAFQTIPAELKKTLT